MRNRGPISADERHSYDEEEIGSRPAASDMSEVKRCRGNQVKSSQVKTSPIVKLILALCERHGTLPTPGPVSLVSMFIDFCRSLSVRALLEVRLVAPIRSASGKLEQARFAQPTLVLSWRKQACKRANIVETTLSKHAKPSSSGLLACTSFGAWRWRGQGRPAGRPAIRFR